MSLPADISPIETVTLGASACPGSETPLGRFDAALTVAAANPTDGVAVATFRAARLTLAQSVLASGSHDAESALLTDTLARVDRLCASGLLDLPATADESATLATCATAGANGLVAGMLLSAVWRWESAPQFDQVPNALWGNYARWVFSPVQSFQQTGDAQRYADALLPRLEALATWVERNWGSAAVRAAVEAYLKSANSIPLYFSAGSLRRHAEARGRILQRTLCTDPRNAIAPEAFARYGRPLRIGFVAEQFDNAITTLSTLPWFEQLDSQRFEVVLFAVSLSADAVESRAQRSAKEFHVLPSTLPEQLETLRMAGLDVLVFAADVATSLNAETKLAIHRCAPLQIATAHSPHSTGLANIDLFLSGNASDDDTTADHYTERLALMAGTSRSIETAALQSPAEPTWSRATLGLSDEDFLFATAVDDLAFRPETRTALSQLLAATPGSRLLLHLPANDNGSASRAQKLIEADLVAAGVNDDRLLIVADRFESPAGLADLLRLADLYLDNSPMNDDHAVVALTTGVPVIARTGETLRSRRTAALLRSAGLDECIHETHTAWLEGAIALVHDQSRRVALRTRLAENLEAVPSFADTLAASDAFGTLVTHAYDTLAEAGAKAFTRHRRPFAVRLEQDIKTIRQQATDHFASGALQEAEEEIIPLLGAAPTDAEARLLLARSHAAANRHDRATHYYLGVVQGGDERATVWRELAQSLNASGQGSDAITALETAIRLDAADIESWLMLGDICVAAGHEELLSEVRQVLTQLAPEDDRVIIFVSQTSTNDRQVI